MGINSALCCGIIGYIVVQSMAAKEMKNYGITASTFGLKKSSVDHLIAQIRAQPPVPAPTSFDAPPPGP